LVPDDEATPLPLEVKVFDPPQRDLADVKQGFTQVVEYAGDYGRADGYLVVFDASAGGLAVQGDVPGEYPPSFAHSGVRIFVVVVPIAEPVAASKKKTPRVTITSNQLTGKRASRQRA
jgi:hypothetical protein